MIDREVAAGTVMAMASSENKTWYIYCHTTPNGKRYIGQTRTKPEYRWRNGQGYSSCPLFNRAIAKYGWDNMEHVVLCSVSSQEYANFLEQWFINKYDTCNPEHGYNLAAGGSGMPGVPKSEETRRKVSESLKEAYRTGRRKPTYWSQEMREKHSERFRGENGGFYGKHHTKEFRQHMHDVLTGRQFTDEHLANLRKALAESPKRKRTPVCQFSMEGEFIAEYPTVAAAVRATNVKSFTIRECCKGRYRQAGGYIWRFKSQPETFPSPVEGLFS